MENLNTVDVLLKKAAASHCADEAMKFAQAAYNAANALRVVSETSR